MSLILLLTSCTLLIEVTHDEGSEITPRSLAHRIASSSRAGMFRSAARVVIFASIGSSSANIWPIWLSVIGAGLVSSGLSSSTKIEKRLPAKLDAYRRRPCGVFSNRSSFLNDSNLASSSRTLPSAIPALISLFVLLPADAPRRWPRFRLSAAKRSFAVANVEIRKNPHAELPMLASMKTMPKTIVALMPGYPARGLIPKNSKTTTIPAIALIAANTNNNLSRIPRWYHQPVDYASLLVPNVRERLPRARLSRSD